MKRAIRNYVESFQTKVLLCYLWICGHNQKKFFFDSYPGSSHKTFYNRSCDAYTNIIMKVMLYSYPIMEVMLNLCNYGGHAEPMQLWGTC